MSKFDAKAARGMGEWLAEYYSTPGQLEVAQQLLKACDHVSKLEELLAGMRVAEKDPAYVAQRTLADNVRLADELDEALTAQGEALGDLDVMKAERDKHAANWGLEVLRNGKLKAQLDVTVEALTEIANSMKFGKDTALRRSYTMLQEIAAEALQDVQRTDLPK